MTAVINERLRIGRDDTRHRRSFHDVMLLQAGAAVGCSLQPPRQSLELSIHTSDGRDAFRVSNVRRSYCRDPGADLNGTGLQAPAHRCDASWGSRLSEVQGEPFEVPTLVGGSATAILQEP